MMSQLSSSGAASLVASDIAEMLQTNMTSGLASSEAEKRFLVYGPNSFDIKEDVPLWRKYLSQFYDPMMMLLLTTATISLFMQQYDDAVSITGAVIIAVSVAFIQEYRSEKLMESLTHLLPPECHCLRDGDQSTMLAQYLVPGDVVFIAAGDRVPADLRLFTTNSLCIDESSFTGEMKPVEKNTEAQRSALTYNISEFRNLAFMGSLVTMGNGKGIVIRTGQDSEFGEIFKMMQAEEAPKTPLQKSMDKLGEQLSLYSMLVIGVIMAVGCLQGRKLLDMFTIGVSLAVAAIPEGLPIVVTVTLAIGVMRMVQKKAIIKRLPIVETLGCVDVICFDKTGTLTLNQMTVTHIITAENQTAELSGEEFYTMEGIKVSRGNLSADESLKAFIKAIEVGSVCNNADVHNGQIIGNPTEAALIAAAKKVELPDLSLLYNRVEEWPFTSETKFMMVKCQMVIDQEQVIYFMKGALEEVFKRSTHYYDKGESVPFTEAAIERFKMESLSLEESGLRVLGLAYGKDVDSMGYVGLVGIIDPLREEVRSTVMALAGMQVQVKMVTGDGEATAKAIARRSGIAKDRIQAISGEDLEAMSLEDLSQVIETVEIVYRSTPRHKVKIVKALQATGHVVAMTGDGVNDAVALKTADIGISMGIGGTDISKEAADLILVDDNLCTILSAIEEGKGIFFNIKNFVKFQLSTSIAALSIVAVAMLSNLPNPLNAMQILWINFIMDGPPAQSLGVEPVSPQVLLQPPRKIHEHIITQGLIKNILISSIFIICGTLWVYTSELVDGLTSARDTTMTFTCFVFFDMFNALSCRTNYRSLFSAGVTSNKFFLLAVSISLICQMLVIYTPPLQAIFQTEALYFSDLCYLAVLASSVFIVAELHKFYNRQFSLRVSNIS